MTSPKNFSREHLNQFQVFRNVLIDPIWELLRQCEVRNLGADEVLLEKDQSNNTIFWFWKVRQRSVSMKNINVKRSN